MTILPLVVAETGPAAVPVKAEASELSGFGWAGIYIGSIGPASAVQGIDSAKVAQDMSQSIEFAEIVLDSFQEDRCMFRPDIAGPGSAAATGRTGPAA